MTKASTDKWQAVHRPGGVYCAPRCGYGCKKASYDKAVKMATALAKRMGAGWEPDVWENLGWHWRIRHGEDHTISQNRDGTFTAEVLSGLHQTFAEAKTPEDALGFAIQDARTFVRRIENSLASLSE